MREMNLVAERVIVLREDGWINFNRYFLVCCVLLFSSAASTIAKSDPFLVAFTVYAISMNLLSRKSYAFTINLLKISIVFGLITFIYYFKNGAIDVYSWYGLLCKLFLGYSCLTYCDNQFEKHFLKVIYVLGIISLFLYAIQLVNFELIYKLNSIFSLPANRGLEPNSNSLLFNAAPIHSLRNCGFMWEPGAFASVLIIALAISFKCSLKVDLQKVVLMLCLITTFSSMGYISLLIIVIYFLYKKLKYYSIILVVPLALMFYNFNILSAKIGKQIEDVDSELLSTQFSDEYVIHLNRFASFYADYSTFIENPVFGLGIDIYTVGEKEYYKNYDKNIVRTSGLMSLLVKIGALGFIFFIFLIYRKINMRYKDPRFATLFVALLLIILFSNPIELSPVILMFLSL